MVKKTEPICPLIKCECEGAGCSFWVQIMGKHPQTGEQINMPDCAIRWLPVLLIENTKAGIETGASVESFRNEMVKSNNVALAIQAKAQGLLK
jgi:hypothetical protein